MRETDRADAGEAELFPFSQRLLTETIQALPSANPG
jgi:hypothetical protein